jgi:uncharacterized protein
MIKYIEISNFYSINTEQVLDFEIGLNADSKFKTQPVIGFAGSNASGKTNTLKAIAFLKQFILESLVSGKSILNYLQPFAGSKQQNSIFTLNFQIQSTIYWYKLELNIENVIKESLFYELEAKEYKIYERTTEKISFGKNIKRLSKEIVDDLPKTSSLLPYFAKFPSQEHASIVVEYFEKLIENIYEIGSDFTNLMANNDIYFSHTVHFLNQNFKETTLRILKYADTGIVDFGVVEYTADSSDIAKMFLTQNMLMRIGQDEEFKEALVSTEMMQKKKGLRFKKPIFHHTINNEIYIFGIEHQSNGTKELLILLKSAIATLHNGSLLIIDEIDAKLHPDIINFIINLFNSPYENPKNAQLIFSFHNSQFMQNLKPEQLWFAQKNKQGETELYPASAFDFIEKIKKDEGTVDLEHYYRAGRFQAKPAISYISQTAL